MNWKKKLGCFLGITVFIMTACLFGKRETSQKLSPKLAYADTYQFAFSSWTVTNIQVSSFSWTQVDNPSLAGRTSIEIYSLDTSSPIYCRQDNQGNLFAGFVSTNATAGLIVGRRIPQAPTTAIAGSNWWSLSLSNFSSNRGAFPTSVAMPVYCVTANVTVSSVTVTQSY